MDVLPCRLLLCSQHFNYRYSMVSIYINGPRRDKTCLRGFRQSELQKPVSSTTENS